MSAVTAQAPDRLARQQLAEALDLINDGGACCFWACEGPDAPYTQMKTCNACRAVQLLRRALKRMGITEGEK